LLPSEQRRPAAAGAGEAWGVLGLDLAGAGVVVQCHWELGEALGAAARGGGDEIGRGASVESIA